MARAIDIQPIIEEIKSALDISSYSEHDKGFDDGLEYVLDLIEKGPTLTPPNAWVSVEDAMPPELKMVLVYCGGLYCVAWWVRNEAGEALWACKTEPQLWMLIPEVK